MRLNAVIGITLVLGMFPKTHYGQDVKFNPKDVRKAYSGKSIEAIEFTQDSEHILVSEFDLARGLGTGRVTNVRISEGKGDVLVGPVNVVRAVSISNDNKHVAVGSDQVIILSASDFKKARALGTGSRYVKSLAFSRDGTLLAAGLVIPDKADPSVHMWDVGSGKKLFSVQGDAASRMPRFTQVTGLGFTADGMRLVTAGSGSDIVIWNVKDGTKINSFAHTDGDINAFTISRDGTRFATGSLNGVVCVWTDQGKLETTIKSEEYEDGDQVNSLCFISDNGSSLAVGFGRAGLQLVDLSSPKTPIKLHAGSAVAIAIARDRRFLAAAIPELSINSTSVLVWKKSEK
ncbi:MAG: hypothetical protein JWM11_1609 [Planctomycetaceae bacterium]|nr:hypothetical protein [Planctomycetaceae bacterium]